MNIVKINQGTHWEAEIDTDIKVGDYVQLTRKWSGKRLGIWKITEFERRIIDSATQKNHGHYVRPLGVVLYHQRTVNLPPIGMELAPLLKVQRVMKECFDGKPTRKDNTKVFLDRVDIVDSKFIADIQSEYDSRMTNLKSLLAGTW